MKRREAYKDQGPHTQSDSEPIIVYCPLHQGWRDGAAKPRPSPKYTVCKPLPLYEPLIDIERKRAIDQASSQPIE